MQMTIWRPELPTRGNSLLDSVIYRYAIKSRGIRIFLFGETLMSLFDDEAVVFMIEVSFPRRKQIALIPH